MKVLCNRATKKIEGFSRWDDLTHDTDTHVLVVVDSVPDFKVNRLNNTEDGIRLATQTELDADIDSELDAKVDFANVDPFLKAFVLAVNDGSIVPGSNISGAAIKAAIKDKL